MEIQGLPSSNANTNVKDTSSQKKLTSGPALSDNGDEKSSGTGAEQSPQMMLDSILDSYDINLPSSRLAFVLDEETGVTVISIIDAETDEVIKQIPPEGILSLRKKMGELQGLLLDRKA